MRKILLTASLLFLATVFASAQTSISNVEKMSGWGSCGACAGAGGNGPVVSYWMHQGVSSPSMDGHASEYHINSGHPYSDVLWWKHLFTGAANSAAHHFVYDTYFYTTNPNAWQAVEFDINQFVNGRSLIFGTQCNVKAGNRWDIWDNVNSRWVHTGIYCGAPAAYKWHHLVIEAERTSTNSLHYIAITLDGARHYINSYWKSKATSWSGVTVNFQLDGDAQQHPYSVWLNKLTLKYW